MPVCVCLTWTEYSCVAVSVLRLLCFCVCDHSCERAVHTVKESSSLQCARSSGSLGKELPQLGNRKPLCWDTTRGTFETYQHNPYGILAWQNWQLSCLYPNKCGKPTWQLSYFVRLTTWDYQVKDSVYFFRLFFVSFSFYYGLSVLCSPVLIYLKNH